MWQSTRQSCTIYYGVLHDVLLGVLHYVLLEPAPLLFSDERWNAVRSSAPWLTWQLMLQRHGLPVSLQAEPTGAERAKGPILDLLLLGGCPDTPPSYPARPVCGSGPIHAISECRPWDEGQGPSGLGAGQTAASGSRVCHDRQHGRHS
jgi:hypothetical protein